MTVEIIRRGSTMVGWQCPECRSRRLRITAIWNDHFWQCLDCGCEWREKQR